MANVKVKIGTLENPTDSIRDYLYMDINSDLRINKNRTDIINNSDINAVFGSLKNLFDYSPGERILEPEFGISFKDLLYEPMNDNTANSIGMLIFNGIKKWEPRILIDNINVYPDFDDNTYYITLQFKIKGISVNKPIVFTYDLKRTL